MSGQGSDASAEGVTRPVLRVERGNPSPDDLAAIVAILAASVDAQGGSVPAARLFGWASRAPRMRAPHPRGPGAWRSGSIPR